MKMPRPVDLQHDRRAWRCCGGAMRYASAISR
jgi:hypothetical protein